MSPPRTGTGSLCVMANMCGYVSNHAPLKNVDRYAELECNFFADTPCFELDHIKRWVSESDDNKFIYSEKDPIKCIESWCRVGLLNNYKHFTSASNELLNPGQQYDREIYLKAFTSRLSIDTAEEIFTNHRVEVMSIIPSDRLLIYNFTDGWGPFCNFLEVEEPEEPIPRYNTNTMFDV